MKYEDVEWPLANHCNAIPLYDDMWLDCSHYEKVRDICTKLPGLITPERAKHLEVTLGNALTNFAPNCCQQCRMERGRSPDYLYAIMMTMQDRVFITHAPLASELAFGAKVDGEAMLRGMPDAMLKHPRPHLCAVTLLASQALHVLNLDAVNTMTNDMHLMLHGVVEHMLVDSHRSKDAPQPLDRNDFADRMLNALTHKGTAGIMILQTHEDGSVVVLPYQLHPPLPDMQVTAPARMN